MAAILFTENGYEFITNQSGLETVYVQVSRTPGTTQEIGHGVASVREAPRHEIAGCFEVYGDLTGSAMMAAVA
jgi:hypothetical protein